MKKEDYIKIVDECFPLPPKNVPEVIEKVVSKYPSHFEFIYKNKKMIGGVVVVKITNWIYGLSAVSIKPKEQGKGYGKKLILKIHKKYKGLFILKTRKPKFFKKLGYKTILKKDNVSYMIYLNEVLEIDF